MFALNTAQIDSELYETITSHCRCIAVAIDMPLKGGFCWQVCKNLETLFFQTFFFHRATKLNTSNWHGGFPSLLRQDGVKETGREAHPVILRKIGFRFWKTATEVQGILLVSLDECGNPTINIIINLQLGIHSRYTYNPFLVNLGMVSHFTTLLEVL